MELCSGIPSWLGGNQSTCKCRSLWSHRLDPWVRRIPWRRKCNPLQYSCQKNPTDRGALWAAVCGVAKSWTQVSKHAQRSTVGFTLEIGQSKQSAAAAAKSLQSCLTLWDPIDGSPPGSPVPGILQARTLEWVAISFSNARKWKVKVKLLSRVRLIATPWTTAYQAPLSVGFSSKSIGVGCHCFPKAIWGYIYWVPGPSVTLTVVVYLTR